MHKYQFIAAFALAITATTSSAVPVSVTGNFTQFTMGAWWTDSPAVRGLAVNGQSINICGADPACTNAINNPSGIHQGLSGSAATFGYDPALLDGLPNSFSFLGNTADVAGAGIQNQFKLGTLTYTNGAFYPLSFIDFTLSSSSSDASLDNHIFSGRIRFDVREAAFGDYQGQADSFQILNVGGDIIPGLGIVGVYDFNQCPPGDPSAPNCNTGSVDLYGHINSLDLDRYANPTGGAFISAVPVPPAIWLMGTAILGLLRFKTRHRA